MNIAEVRAQIPLIRDHIYLDNAGAGPPPTAVYDSMAYFLKEWRDYGEKWENWLLEIVKARELFGRLIGAEVDEVACIPNVTSGLAAIASALPVRGARNVVVSELNFPTNVYIWHSMRQKGLISEVRVLKAKNGQIPISDFEKAIDDKTAAVSVDYVSWINGCRENIKEIAQIAHKHGALMIVDGFHAVGVIPVDVQKLGIDVMTCGTYKWLMGPHGTAFVCVRKDILGELQPAIVGWHGISDSVVARLQAKEETFGRPFDLSGLKPAKDAKLFEWGTWSVITVVGSCAAIEFALKYPAEERAPMIHHLTERLVDGLRKLQKHITSPLEDERRSGIVTFEVDDAAKTANRLKDHGIIVAPRVNTLRISPHFYNSESEIDTFLDKI